MPINQWDRMDIHEALITKHDVERESENVQQYINHPANCVLVHHSCHMRILGHGGDRAFEKCARQLIGFKEPVQEFLTAMKEYVPDVASLALRRFGKIKF